MATVHGFKPEPISECDRRVPPAGWSSWDAFALYMSDPDGGRAPYRMPENPASFAYPPDSTPTAIELLSQEA